jgi:hypothetical protein
MAESWRLKLSRAEKHLLEFDGEVGAYIDRDPYRPVRSVKTKAERSSWLYRIQFDEPDPNLAVIAGDVLHNVRSALDHIAVALVPRKRRSSASFPVIERLNKEAVVGFRTACTGMPRQARAIIKENQPYRAGPSAELHWLTLLSAFENADKHRNLVVVAGGLVNGTVTVTARGRLLSQRTGADFRYRDTEIAHFGWTERPALTEPEVNVEVVGTVLVAFEYRRVNGYVPAQQGLRDLLDTTRLMISRLEPFVS